MAPNGVVVLVKYAHYFNDQTDDCTHEDWTLFSITCGGLPLTPARRTSFNNLVEQTNTALQTAADQAAAVAKTMTLVTANWDPWAPLTNGLFCKLITISLSNIFSFRQ